MSGEAQQTLTDYTRRLLSSPQRTMIQEPVIAQKDEDSIKILKERCYEDVILRNDNGTVVLNDGRPIYVRKLKYEDIFCMLSTIGPLEGTTHYTWEQAQAIQLIWEGTNLDPLKIKYRRDRRAMFILSAIENWKRRQTLGDALGGFRAEHTENITGARRRIETGPMQERVV